MARIESAASLKTRFSKPAARLLIVPSFGCRSQCRHCSFKPVPETPRFIRPCDLDVQLAELTKAGLLPENVVVDYSGGGNPPDHPRLDEITAVVRKHAPLAKINVFWSFLGVPSEEALVRRTRGANRLIVPADYFHDRGLKSELFPKDAAAPSSGRRYATTRAMVDRLKWAFNAAERNGLKLHVGVMSQSLKAPRSHSRLLQRVRVAAVEHGRFEPRVFYFERKPTGGDVERPFPGLVIHHDCRVSDRYELPPKGIPVGKPINFPRAK